MPGVSSRTPRRRGPPKTPEKSAGMSTTQFYSPKTPGWVSGSQMKFELEESPLNNVRKGRKSVIPTGTATQKTTNSRRHTMFKLPEPIRSSPIGTRSRRSSIFNVHSRKGGIRLTIAVTPQEKPKKGPGKVVSPPGVKTRTRRSSVYQKGKTLQEACSQVQKTVASGQTRKMTGTKEKEETAETKKPVSTRRSVCPKSPERSSRTSLHGKVSSPQSNKAARKRKSVQPNTSKSEEKDSNTPVQKKLRKTPRRSVAKSTEEPKVVLENVEAVFKTPARPVSSASEDTQPISSRKQRGSVKETPVSQASKSMEDVKPGSPKITPRSIKKKTPAQSASKQLRSATKRKNRTPALSRSTRKRNVEQSEDDSVVNDTASKVMESKVTLTPELKEDKRTPKSPKLTVKRKMDLSNETPQVKKVRVTEAVSATSSGKSTKSARKTPAKSKSSVDGKSGDTSLDESMEFKTPMKTPRLARSAKKTTKMSADMTPQVKLTKISLPNEDSNKEKESKIETQENQDGNSQKTVQVVSPELSSPLPHSGKLAERKGTPARVQPDAVNREVLLKGKNKKESKIKKLKTKEKSNSTVTLNGSLNTSAHTSMGAKCTIL